MGRPYAEEIATLGATYTWALSANIEGLVESANALRGRPLLAIGSGGSVSACHFVSRLHETHSRLPARVLTPLEFVQYPTIQEAGVLLLSAGGSNPDILAAAGHAISSEYSPVIAVCTRTGTKLSRALSSHRHTSVHEFAGPSAKDGFLATNSLLLTTTLLARAYGVTLPPTLPSLEPDSEWARAAGVRAAQKGVGDLAGRVAGKALAVLASGWSSVAAVDLESKWSEIGFAPVSVTDARNFAHGRHYGVSRRIKETLVLGISTREEQAVVERTLAALPRSSSSGVIQSRLPSAAGALDLLVMVLRLVGEMGKREGIDPGRPKVPTFGRRLYHAGLPPQQATVRSKARVGVLTGHRKHAPEDLWIRRKVSEALWENADEATLEMWRSRCRAWVEVAQSAQIGGVVLDYDGTLCEEDERFQQPSKAVGESLTRLIDDGLLVGIATGRGDSVIHALRRALPNRLWPEIVVGMYNGGVILRLDGEPSGEMTPSPVIIEARAAIEASTALHAVACIRARPMQLTIRPLRAMPDGLLHRLVLEALAADGQSSVSTFSSGRTVDVIAPGVSKLSVVKWVKDLLLHRNDGSQSAAVMTIGDQGQAGGNDSLFLSHPLGLSVERTSSLFDGCWNVAPAGQRRTAALLSYLRALRHDPTGGFRWSATGVGMRKQSISRNGNAQVPGVSRGSGSRAPKPGRRSTPKAEGVE
jgi:hydroxymethylpyrimidine pyrophosphatase-like HAD family hydrolase/fructoselysine-6-P-deglycase FrlB-like protein